MITVDEWVESQEFQIRLDAQGKIIDYLDSSVRRENKPEERIRQKTARILVEEFKYPKEQIALERAIKIGRDETKRADIVIYANAEAKESNRQGEILLIAEIKAPNVKEPDNQIVSYISPTSAQGGFWTNGDRIFSIVVKRIIPSVSASVYRETVNHGMLSANTRRATL